MGLTQILASHSSSKGWIQPGPVSNSLCHPCLFDLWSPKHEANGKKLCWLGMLLLGTWLGCTWDVVPSISRFMGSTLKTFASPLWPGEGFKVCFSALRICISDAVRDSRGRGGAEPAEHRWRWARSCSCHRLGLTPRTWLDSGELVRDEAKLAENQSKSNFPSTSLQS